MQYPLSKVQQLYFLFLSTLSVSPWEMKKKKLKGKVIKKFKSAEGVCKCKVLNMANQSVLKLIFLYHHHNIIHLNLTISILNNVADVWRVIKV